MDRDFTKRQLEGEGLEAVPELIQRAKENGWSELKVEAELVVARAVWLEGQMNGIQVTGYTPTQQDFEYVQVMQAAPRLSESVLGSTVASDYQRRVIPELQRRVEREKRILESSEGRPERFKSELRERVEFSQLALESARSRLTFFKNRATQRFGVYPVYLDGTLRYELRQKQRERVVGGPELSRVVTTGFAK